MENATVINNKEAFMDAIKEKKDFENYLFENFEIEDCHGLHAIGYLNFTNCIFRNVTFKENDFVRLNLLNTKFINCTMSHCSISGLMKFSEFHVCDIRYLNFNNLESINTDFINCKCNRLWISASHVVSKINTALFDKSVLGYLGIHESRIDVQKITTRNEDLKNIYIEDSFVNCGSPEQKIYTIGPIGSRRQFTYYIPCIDFVKCGCWGHISGCGDTLEKFEERVLTVYPKGRYHDEYMNAISFFKEMKANEKKD